MGSKRSFFWFLQHNRNERSLWGGFWKCWKYIHFLIIFWIYLWHIYILIISHSRFFCCCLFKCAFDFSDTTFLWQIVWGNTPFLTFRKKCGKKITLHDLDPLTVFYKEIKIYLCINSALELNFLDTYNLEWIYDWMISDLWNYFWFWFLSTSIYRVLITLEQFSAKMTL